MRGQGEPSREPISGRHIELASTSFLNGSHGSFKRLGVEEVASWFPAKLRQVKPPLMRNRQLVCVRRLDHISRSGELQHAQDGYQHCDR